MQGIDLEIKQGESIAIIGASGSGKSTMLGIMAGLDESSSGEVHLLGSALHDLNEDERAAVRADGVGFVFQSFQLLPGLTAYENISLPIEMSGRYTSKETKRKTLDWLKKVGLDHRIHHYPKQLSGGEQQRVAIARAFSSEPKILFADEPTGNLDRNTGQHIVEQLFSLNSEIGTTLVLVTHDEELAKRCARTVRMTEGKLQEVDD